MLAALNMTIFGRLCKGLKELREELLLLFSKGIESRCKSG